MKASAISLLSAAARTRKWNDAGKLTVLCSHIDNIVPETDFDDLLAATVQWQKDSKLPSAIVIAALCWTIDELEAAPEFSDTRLEEYLKTMVEQPVESQPAVTPVEEPVKPKRPRGRPKKSAEQKFPAGTVAEKLPPKKVTPVEVKTVPAADPQYLLEPAWCKSAKEIMAQDKPYEEQPLGAVMARASWELPDDSKLFADIVNARPKPAIAVYLTVGGKTMQSLKPVRTYADHFELTYNNTNYVIGREE